MHGVCPGIEGFDRQQPRSVGCCPPSSLRWFVRPSAQIRPHHIPALPATTTSHPPRRPPSRYQLHAGGRLAPPLGGAERMAEFPALQPTDVEATGDSWKGSSVDVAIAGALAADAGLQQLGGTVEGHAEVLGGGADVLSWLQYAGT